MTLELPPRYTTLPSAQSGESHVWRMFDPIEHLMPPVTIIFP